MSTPKFKTGDRVKFKDVEGRACVGLISSFYQYDCDSWRYVLEGNGVLSWHESHLSLDVPEPKKYTTDLEAQLGAEIIALHYAAAEREKDLEKARKQIELLEKMAAVQAKGRMEDRDQIERLQRIGNKQAEACEHLSNRLTEEIGGRAHERIAKEASYKQLLHARELLTCETESFSKERRLREAVQSDNRRLIDSKMMLLQEAAIERMAKEAAQKELVQRKENEDWGGEKLSELANELSAERCAKKSAQKELADLRKDLADLRTISKRLAL